MLLSHQKAVDKLKDVLDCQAILPGFDEEIQLAACTLVFCGWEVRQVVELMSHNNMTLSTHNGFKFATLRHWYHSYICALKLLRPFTIDVAINSNLHC